MNPRNKRVLLMLPVLAVAAGLALFGDKTPVEEVAEPAQRGSAAATQPGPVAAAPEAVAPPVVEGELLRVAARDRLSAMIDSPEVRDLFAANRAAEQQTQAPPDEPQQAAPPVQPFTFIGRELDQKRWRYFLEKDGQVFVLSPGQQAEGFRLERTPAGEVALVDLATKTRHIIPIEGE